VRKGEIMGLVGESGSGKSVEAYSILGLLKPPARINAGSILFEGRDILTLKKKELEALRGSEISMVFQNPASCLDPVFTVGQQMIETIRAHDKGVSRSVARSRSIDVLREVRIRTPEQVMRQYPFELSGGMCQRILIAIALLCKPKLLIADEPTTALDVTIQSQIIQILKSLQKQSGMAMLYITHNFGIVAELCDRVSVMCGGNILEQGTTDDIFYRAAHPYTQMLHKTIPRIDSTKKEAFNSIEGTPHDPFSHPEGCVFHPRCPSCMDKCRESAPPRTILTMNHSASCWLLEDKQTHTDERDSYWTNLLY
jgi:oligopeptide transport system ATP-binding protein